MKIINFIFALRHAKNVKNNVKTVAIVLIENAHVEKSKQIKN